MIVIASHNNKNLLKNILENLTNIDLNNHKVLIVDTNSSDPEYLQYFQEAKIQYTNFIFDRKEYTCWDTGAYIHAYKEYKDEKYIFLQDSLKITNKKLIPFWDAFLDVYDVVPLINFGYWYENEEQKKYGEEDLPNHVDRPKDSIFGPIFGVNCSVLDRIPLEWFKEPKNKMEGCGYERRWSYMFHLVNASKHYIHYTNFKKDYTIYNQHQHIHKFFFGRP